MKSRSQRSEGGGPAVAQGYGVASRGKTSSRFINLAAVTDVMRIDASLRQIEFVKNTVITDSQLKLRAPMESLVRELFQSRAQFIQFSLNRLTDRSRERIE